MMKTGLVWALAMTLCVTTNAQNFEWADPTINAVNRMPMHTSFFAYETAECPVVLLHSMVNGILIGCRMQINDLMISIV